MRRVWNVRTRARASIVSVPVVAVARFAYSLLGAFAGYLE